MPCAKGGREGGHEGGDRAITPGGLEFQAKRWGGLFQNPAGGRLVGLGSANMGTKHPGLFSCRYS